MPAANWAGMEGEMPNWATDRLDQLVRGDVVLPPVTRTLRLGMLDSWGPGWIKKTWSPDPDLLNVDGSLFGGYIAALADQALTFAAMTSVPDGMVFRTMNLSVTFLRVGKAEKAQHRSQGHLADAPNYIDPGGISAA